MYDVYHEQRECRIGRNDLVVISQANPYSLRNSTQLRPIRCYTEAYKLCFLPYGISLLNDILSSKPTCLNDMSRACFKSFINPKVKHNGHFDVYHTRKSQVLMARLCCNNADLNENLFSIKLSTSDICPKCGLHVETIEHYFIYCTAYGTSLRHLVITHLSIGLARHSL